MGVGVHFQVEGSDTDAKLCYEVPGGALQYPNIAWLLPPRKFP